MEGSRCLLVVLAILSLCCGGGKSLDESLLPSGALRDDILFDIAWPGLPEETDSSKTSPSEQESQQDSKTGGTSGDKDDVALGQAVEKSSEKKVVQPNSLLSESSYAESNYVDMRTSSNEQYHCIIPEIHTWEMNEEDDDSDDEENSAETLLKTLSTKCTKLLLGYWAYELCHWRHVRQYHEPIKQTVGDKDKDEYYLGRYYSSNVDERKEELESDSHPGMESGDRKEAETSSTTTVATKKTKKEKKEIPVWYFNGDEYPYYEVEMTGGTPCDLKGDQPRSILIRYICDMNSHSTGTFLNIEEVTTCKYEAVVSTVNLCQNRAYRLKENPVHTVKCFSKDGSPSKPTSLLEHEISMMRHLQGAKHQKSAKTPKKLDSGVDEDDNDLEGVDGGDYPSDSGVSRESAAPLDENFVRSFLSGELCLRGGAGWWQHEVCYGKYVKQIHEEVGKDPQELLLGVWLEEGHQRWFASAGHRKQSNNHVIHLYMNGDLCDVTKVARQCQVKFRCSKSARMSQISLFLEEPTTCNYILTVEAAFLCPLVQNADHNGYLIYPWVEKGGMSGPEEGEEREWSADEEEYDEDGNLKSESKNLKSEWDSERQEEKKDKTSPNER